MVLSVNIVFVKVSSVGMLDGGDSLASQLYWTLYKQGELYDKTLLGRASHLIHNNELTFTKTIFNDIFHINTKSVLFEHVTHGRNGLIDSLRVIFND